MESKKIKSTGCFGFLATFLFIFGGLGVVGGLIFNAGNYIDEGGEAHTSEQTFLFGLGMLVVGFVFYIIDNIIHRNK